MARKVLLADDSIAIQKAVEASLEPRDFEVSTVAGGNKAIENAREARPDLIILDSVLKDGDGYEICRRIKADPELSSIPVLLLISEGPDASRAKDAGADGHLTKPFQEKELVDAALSLAGRDVSTAELDEELVDLEEGDETHAGLDLGGLELEGEELLELTDEVGEELSTDIESSDEFKLEEDLSFEDQLKDIDLEDLDLESGEEALSLALDEEKETGAETNADKPNDMTDDEDTIDLGLDEDLISLEEEISLEEPEQDEIQRTGVETVEPPDKQLTETYEEFVSVEKEVSAEQPAEKEELSLDETIIDWSGEQKPDEAELSVEAEKGEEIIDTGIEEEAGWPEISEFESEKEAGVEQEVDLEDVAQEISLEQDEIAEEISPGWDAEFEELSAAEIPPLEEGMRMELTEEDFGLTDPFFEERVRREISKRLADMVENIVNKMAEPIVERVAREVALERTEKILMEEIERLKSQPEGL